MSITVGSVAGSLASSQLVVAGRWSAHSLDQRLPVCRPAIPMPTGPCSQCRRHNLSPGALTYAMGRGRQRCAKPAINLCPMMELLIPHDGQQSCSPFPGARSSSAAPGRRLPLTAAHYGLEDGDWSPTPGMVLHHSPPLVGLACVSSGPLYYPPSCTCHKTEQNYL